MTPHAAGPSALFAAWVLHDIEEAATFPRWCGDLADRAGIEALRMTRPQSWAAVGIMGGLVGFACWRGARTGGRSPLYRAIAAGLEAHVGTHVAASLATRRYTPGAATAVPVMLPGAAIARRALRRQGVTVRGRDLARGAAILIPAAAACHALARLLLPSR